MEKEQEEKLEKEQKEVKERVEKERQKSLNSQEFMDGSVLLELSVLQDSRVRNSKILCLKLYGTNTFVEKY